MVKIGGLWRTLSVSPWREKNNPGRVKILLGNTAVVFSEPPTSKLPRGYILSTLVYSYLFYPYLIPQRNLNYVFLVLRDYGFYDCL